MKLTNHLATRIPFRAPSLAPVDDPVDHISLCVNETLVSGASAILTSTAVIGTMALVRALQGEALPLADLGLGLYQAARLSLPGGLAAGFLTTAAQRGLGRSENTLTSAAVAGAVGGAATLGYGVYQALNALSQIT